MPNWDHVLREVQKEKDDPSGGASAHDKVRRKYLLQLHDHRGRNIIAYYSGFLTKPNVEGIEITDEDKNGFMLCIHQLDRSKGLDLILHTPGADVAATESLVHYLRKMFGSDICAFVPQIAMSAGTMIACSCREIFMGKHSNLGPVDPQLSGIPAYGVIQEVERAYSEIKSDNARAYVWNPILSRYPPSFLQQCHWAIERTEDFVKAALQLNMLSTLPDNDRTAAAERIFDRLFDLKKNKGHDKHLHAEDCKEIGLTITDIETDAVLQDLVLTVHHCYMHTLANTGAAKLIENHVGRCYAKIVQQLLVLPGSNPSVPTAVAPSGLS
jgi:Serine dehydrogenase proteinase